MKKFWPIGFLILFFIILFKDFFFKGLIPVPADTLVGAYYPWLDYKWGYEVGVPIKNAIISDVFSYFFIIKHISTDILKQGIIPYWNNFSFSGTPLLATFHSTVLSPWNLFFLLPKYLGWGMNIFTSVLFAAMSMYFYLTVLVKNRIARIVGALVFSLAGPMTTWVEFGTAVWAAGSIPLILLGMEMAIIYHKPKYYSLITVSTVLLVLSGHVQLLTYAMIIVPIYVFFRARNLKKIFLAILSMAVGFLLTAIQLIPTADFYTRSIRADDKYSSTFNYGLVPVTELIRFWVPDFFGNPVTGNTWGGFIYHEYASFLGTLIIPLVIAALFYRRSFAVFFFSGLFLVSLFFVLDQPLSRGFFALPLPLITYSSASRLFFLSVLGGSVLAATFLDSPKWKRVLLITIFLMIITVIANLITPEIFQKISLKNSLLPVLQLTILGFLIFSKKNHRLIPLIILVLITFDLSRYFLKYNPFVRSDLIFPPTPVIDYLKQSLSQFRLTREPGALMPPNTWSMYGFENIEGYDPLYLTGYNRFFHVVNNQPYFNTAGRYSELTDFNPAFLDATNVRFLLSIKPKDPDQISPYTSRIKAMNYPLVFTDGNTQIYQNPNVLSRAYFVKKIHTVPTEVDLANILNDPNFNPRETAVLIKSPDRKSGSGQVRNYLSGPNTFSFEVSASSAGFMVIANAYDPGWSAAVNGQPVAVVRSNGGLLGIDVPVGDFKVVFRYLPPFMSLAVTLSALTWLGVVTSCFVLTRKIV